MVSATCRYSLACRPLVYSKCPSRRPPVRRSRATTSSWVGTSCINCWLGFGDNGHRLYCSTHSSTSPLDRLYYREAAQQNSRSTGVSSDGFNGEKLINSRRMRTVRGRLRDTPVEHAIDLADRLGVDLTLEFVLRGIA